MSNREISQLIDELNAARDAYYNGGQSNLTDKEYDDKLAKLEKLQSELLVVPTDSPVGKVGAAVRDNGLAKVHHEIRARSLDKTKEIDKVVDKLGSDDRELVVGMWKLDGCTLILTYIDGDLVLAATRGDGETGQDVTNNIKYVAGIPQHINMQKGKLIVRGECIMSYADFEQINANLPEGIDAYANPRNLASASITMINPEDMKDRHLAFQAFDFILAEGSVPFDDIFENDYSLVDQFGYLSANGFGVVNHSIFRLSDIDQVVKQFTADVESFEYPVDGLVFALDDRKLSSELPGTEHHPDPKYGYAFKWADEEVETTLRDIEWSPSRTGLLNPVAIFDPVQIAGTTVSRASLHNLSYIKKKMLALGSRITVAKQNMIIPQVIQNLSEMVDEDEEISVSIAIDNNVPHMCPTCRGEVEIRNNNGIETVWCANPNCPEKLIGNLAHFCSKDGLDIDGWSEETLKKLIELKMVKEHSDIFKLHIHPELAFVPGFGKRSWEKLCQSASEASNTTFVKFVSSLSIPGVGKGQAKIFKKYIDDNYESLSEMYGVSTYLPFAVFVEMGLHHYDFTCINGIGEIMNSNITNWIEDNFRLDDSMYSRLVRYITFKDSPPVKNDFMNPPENQILSGKSFCITGKLIHHSNRQELVDLIEANGGKWIDSVSSKTDYLINNDITSTSGKNKKAKDLHIPIISEEDLLAMLS